MIRRTLLCLLIAGLLGPAIVNAQEVLLGIFAHPDDEGIVGPVLARYAREGKSVTVVMATDGRLGVNEFSGYSAGDELAAVRREEMNCAAEKLGVELVHLEYFDQFNSAEGYDGFIPQLQGLIRDIARIIEEKQPDAIVTFGPDGVSNHMDHQLVSSSVTQALVSREWDDPPALYYFGIPASTLDEDARTLRGVRDDYLTVRVPFTEEDAEKAIEAWQCHVSQFGPDAAGWMRSRMDALGGMLHFRPFGTPTGMSDTLFR